MKNSGSKPRFGTCHALSPGLPIGKTPRETGAPGDPKGRPPAALAEPSDAPNKSPNKTQHIASVLATIDVFSTSRARRI